jgi:hypothetical protein
MRQARFFRPFSLACSVLREIDAGVELRALAIRPDVVFALPSRQISAFPCERAIGHQGTIAQRKSPGARPGQWSWGIALASDQYSPPDGPLSKSHRSAARCQWRSRTRATRRGDLRRRVVERAFPGGMTIADDEPRLGSWHDPSGRRRSPANCLRGRQIDDLTSAPSGEWARAQGSRRSRRSKYFEDVLFNWERPYSDRVGMPRLPAHPEASRMRS